MRRQLIVVGLAVFALLLLASITATLAAPTDAPMRQTTETEPNNSFAEADARPRVPVPGYVNGNLTDASLPEDTLDYFLMDTEIGRQYQANLSILGRTGGLNLMMSLYNGNRGFISSNSSSVSWTAYTSTHYILIEALLATTTTVQSADYRLTINQVAEPPTATPSPTPSNTPTPTNTPPAVPPSTGDSYEPNDSFDNAYTLPVMTTISLSGLNFYPAGDQDWFRLWTKPGKSYQVSTNALSGVDTFLEIRDRYNSVITSDDDGGDGYASKASWASTYEGYYYIRLTNKAGSGTYSLKVEEIDADPTSTPGPTPINPGADRCDKTELGNHDFDHACVISANKPEDFNFSPPPYGGPDNDFFKIWVKPGLLFECTTSDLSYGVDPNMILYDHNRNVIGGNDDLEPGDYNSYFAYFATYEGWMYLLLGTGDRTPSDLEDSNYTLACTANVPGEATATSTPETSGTPGATPTPAPPGATPTPSIATPPPAADLTVRPLTTPTPAPATTPASQFVPITLLVYFDANDDRQPGAGEGIAGISAQAYEVTTNQLLAQGFTDEQGNLEFTVSVQGPARVSVPFFGFSQLVAGKGASIYLRVPPQPRPGETP